MAIFEVHISVDREIVPHHTEVIPGGLALKTKGSLFLRTEDIDCAARVAHTYNATARRSDDATAWVRIGEDES